MTSSRTTIEANANTVRGPWEETLRPALPVAVPATDPRPADGRAACGRGEQSAGWDDAGNEPYAGHGADGASGRSGARF